MNRRRLQTVVTEVRELTLLSGPIVFTQLGQISNGFVDVVMVGRLGPAELAGVALGNATYFLFALVGIGVLMAVGPMVSQAYGANESAPIERTVRQALWLGTAVALPAFLIMWNASPLWALMRQDPATIDLAQGYLKAAAWGLLPFMWFNGLRNFVEAISRPLPVTLIIVCGIGLNIVANYGLMFGNFGLPRLGLVGTGWATTFVNCFMLSAIAIYIKARSHFRAYRIFSGLWRRDFHYFKELLRIGLPVGGSYGLEVTLFTTTAFLVGTLGPTPLAAHQIAIQCAAVAYMVPLGIGIATSVRVGQNIGRRSIFGAAWAGYIGMALATVFMTGTALLFLLAPHVVVGIYMATETAANSETAHMAIRLLGVAALFQLFDGLQVTAQGALRGLKDTRTPMLLCFVGYWLIGMPSGILLGFGWGWGATGLWWGLVMGLLAASVMLSARFVILSRRRPRYPSPAAGAL